MPTAKSLLGRRAEDLARAELVRRGYEFLGANYRCRYGEIDIVAREGRTLVFIEVKSRRSNDPTTPAEAVSERKQAKLILTAQHYLSSQNYSSDADCRFDVIEVRFERGKPVSVDVIKNAFGEA